MSWKHVDWAYILEIAQRIASILALPVAVWSALNARGARGKASDVLRLMVQQQQRQVQSQVVNIYGSWINPDTTTEPTGE